jgi:hypothetical protein
MLKYELPVFTGTLDLPYGSVIHHVGHQHDKAYVWVEASSLFEGTEPRTFTIYATGETISDARQVWRATWQDGPYVWHLFETG